MIVLISPEHDIPNELALLHKLFEAGLKHFHFRKPSYDITRQKAYLAQIAPEFLPRVMIHDHHELTKIFNVRGIHLEERKWREKGDNLSTYVANFKKDGFKVSSSYHEVEDLAAQEVNFDYYLLSPIFSAISKPGYEGRGFKVSHIPKKIVGMGGINATTTPKAMALGFEGVGALGGIWADENPIEAFKSIKNAIQRHDTL
jgi:thiamine-phosphate pyrophosphorylase